MANDPTTETAVQQAATTQKGAKMTKDRVRAMIREVQDAGSVEGVTVLDTTRISKTSIIAGSERYFREGKVTIIVLEE